MAFYFYFTSTTYNFFLSLPFSFTFLSGYYPIHNTIIMAKNLARALNYTTLSEPTATTLREEPENLRIIGLGSCGTVFEIPDTELACKKGTKEFNMWKDFCLTNRVHNAAQEARNILQDAFPMYTIPRTPLCHEYHPVDEDMFWSTNLQRFPASHRNKQPLFIVDRILPLPQQIRMDLIEEYFDQDESIQQEAKEDPDNKD